MGETDSYGCRMRLGKCAVRLPAEPRSADTPPPSRYLPVHSHPYVVVIPTAFE